VYKRQVLASGGDDIPIKLATSVFSGLAIVAALLLAGRFLLKPALAMVANASHKNSELFVAATLLSVLSAAYTTEYFGLSLALGAFIAGLMIAETEYKKQVEVDINPFKGLLMGLFFMTVGMSFNLSELIRRFPEVILFSVLLIATKAAIIYGICRIFKLSSESSTRSSIILAQGGEFAFVLFGLAMEKHLLDSYTGQLLLLVVSFTMVLTPLLYNATLWYFKKFKYNKRTDISYISEAADLDGHFILCGFGWVGENLAKLFSEEGISFVAIEQEPKRVKAGRDMGLPVFYGDATRPEIMESLRIKKAKAVIVTIHDSKPVKRVVQSIHTRFKEVPIIARAKHVEAVEGLKKAGATTVVPEAYESAMLVARNAMAIHGYGEKEINRAVTQFMEERLEEES
jgi:CPA2 family monovalent cation:H+ antiporter-2